VQHRVADKAVEACHAEPVAVEHPVVLPERLRVVGDRPIGRGDLEDLVALNDMPGGHQMLSPTWNAVPMLSSPAGVSTAT
jgi:hypothetical protein